MMRQLLKTLMLANAALFVFGALQHAGVAFGPLQEPVIIPASIVELICAVALIWGAVAILRRSPVWRSAWLRSLWAPVHELPAMISTT